MTESFYFSLSIGIIDKLNKKLGRHLSRSDINKLAKDYLTNFADAASIVLPKEMKEELKLKKLKAEILKLNIDNQLKLMRDLKKTPDEVNEIVHHDQELQVIDDSVIGSDKLSNEQWDYVYGCILEGYKKKLGDLSIECMTCKQKFSKDETARQHLITNHPDNIKKAITEMGYSIEG